MNQDLAVKKLDVRFLLSVWKNLQVIIKYWKMKRKKKEFTTVLSLGPQLLSSSYYRLTSVYLLKICSLLITS